MAASLKHQLLFFVAGSVLAFSASPAVAQSTPSNLVSELCDVPTDFPDYNKMCIGVLNNNLGNAATTIEGLIDVVIKLCAKLTLDDAMKIQKKLDSEPDMPKPKRQTMQFCRNNFMNAAEGIVKITNLDPERKMTKIYDIKSQYSLAKDCEKALINAKLEDFQIHSAVVTLGTFTVMLGNAIKLQHDGKVEF